MSAIAKDFDPAVFGVAAMLAVACDLALDLDLDGVDDIVVLEELEDASLHVARAIQQVHEEWYKARGDAESQALRLFKRYGPDAMPDAPPQQALRSLMDDCIKRARPAIAYGWCRRELDDRYAKVGYELDAAVEHCERVIYVLDPTSEIGIPSIPDYADDLVESVKRREAVIDRVNAHRAEITGAHAALN